MKLRKVPKNILLYKILKHEVRYTEVSLYICINTQ